MFLVPCVCVCGTDDRLSDSKDDGAGGGGAGVVAAGTVGTVGGAGAGLCCDSDVGAGAGGEIATLLVCQLVLCIPFGIGKTTTHQCVCLHARTGLALVSVTTPPLISTSNSWSEDP